MMLHDEMTEKFMSILLKTVSYEKKVALKLNTTRLGPLLLQVQLQNNDVDVIKKLFPQQHANLKPLFILTYRGQVVHQQCFIHALNK